MKKIYQIPTTIIVKINVTQMIASSPGQQNLSKDDTPVVSSEEIGSRRGRSVWDDDEDDDYGY